MREYISHGHVFLIQQLKSHTIKSGLFLTSTRKTNKQTNKQTKKKKKKKKTPKKRTKKKKEKRKNFKHSSSVM